MSFATEAAPGSGVPRALTLRTARLHQKTWLLGFEEIPDRTGAESLRGTRLFIDAEAAAAAAADEDDAWYEDDLIGLTPSTPPAPPSVRSPACAPARPRTSSCCG